MKITISESFDSRQWDDRICSLGGTIFHSSVWAEYTKTAYQNVIPWFITLQSDDKKIIGGAIGFQQSSRNRLLSRLSRRLWFDSFPIIQENYRNASSQFLSLIESCARRAGIVELAVGSFANADFTADLNIAGFNLTKRIEFELSLDASEEELWRGLDPKRRNNIRKALSAGVTIHDLPPDEGVLELRRLQNESSQRIVKRGGPDISFKGLGSTDPILILLRAGFGRIVGAKIDHSYVSASFFTSFNGLVYHNQSGHSQKELKFQAPTLLLWESIKRYQKEGAKKFNFGGCSIDAIIKNSPEHGVYTYKRAFAKMLLECTSGQKIIRKTTHKINQFLKYLFQLKKGKSRL